MDAIELLKKDHAGAKEAMEEILKGSGTPKKELFAALKRELEAHDHIEETIFYPAVKSNPKTAALPAADKKAHEVVEAALAHLALLPVTDATWDAGFKSMQEKLLAHVKDEETNVFIKIRDVLSANELAELGHKIVLEKERLLKAVPRA